MSSCNLQKGHKLTDMWDPCLSQQSRQTVLSSYMCLPCTLVGKYGRFRRTHYHDFQIAIFNSEDGVRRFFEATSYICTKWHGILSQKTAFSMVPTHLCALLCHIRSNQRGCKSAQTERRKFVVLQPHCSSPFKPDSGHIRVSALGVCVYITDKLTVALCHFNPYMRHMHIESVYIL